jgi:carbamoyltransferase
MGRPRVHTHAHHLCHAAAGFQTSPYADATVVVIDAIGEFDTVTIWDATYNANGCAKYKKLWSQQYPHSIGLFYSAMTQRVGLHPLDEEYILMGMAAYGMPQYLREMQQQFLNSKDNSQFVQNLHIGVDQEFLPNADPMDIACSAQILTEQLIRNVISRARQLGTSKNLVYGGGVALNCVANRLLGDFYENIWIVPNPGDAGSSLGCAAMEYFSLTGKKVKWDGPYLGYEIKGPYPVEKSLASLRAGEIFGIANGKAEFGPRALGNRSLMADPRGNDIKDRVNKIKHRQEFRPFAPVILEEHVHEYFDMPNGVSSPYMQFVARCRFSDIFPAIVHVDGTSRVQTVNKNQHPDLYRLLIEFYKETGCPMLLNTSLNIKGQPIVNDEQDAIAFSIKYNIPVHTKD